LKDIFSPPIHFFFPNYFSKPILSIRININNI
jgi:hypothetical protein